jgi:hypothetical protein
MEPLHVDRQCRTNNQAIFPPQGLAISVIMSTTDSTQRKHPASLGTSFQALAGVKDEAIEEPRSALKAAASHQNSPTLPNSAMMYDGHLQGPTPGSTNNIQLVEQYRHPQNANELIASQTTTGYEQSTWCCHYCTMLKRFKSEELIKK